MSFNQLIKYLEQSTIGTTTKAKWVDWSGWARIEEEPKENKMWKWCKRCFGMKTVKQRMEEELGDAEREQYTLQKRIDYDHVMRVYYFDRIRYLKDKLNLLGVDEF